MHAAQRTLMVLPLNVGPCRRGALFRLQGQDIIFEFVKRQADPGDSDRAHRSPSVTTSDLEQQKPPSDNRGSQLCTQ